jgi:hypothetical protein
MELARFGVVKPRLRYPQRYLVLRRIDGLEVFIDTVVHEPTQIDHVLMIKDVAIVARGVSHILVRFLVQHERLFLST